MFIAHLPTGYLAGRALVAASRGNASVSPKHLMAVSLTASVLPDLDLAWFYWIDNRQHLHHTYWTHVPIFWVGTGVFLSAFATALRRRRLLPYIWALVLGALVHLCLDTVAGGIYWFRPWSQVELRLVDVPSIHAWWVTNFLLHWSFGLEILLVSIALATWRGAGSERRLARRCS